VIPKLVSSQGYKVPLSSIKLARLQLRKAHDTLEFGFLEFVVIEIVETTPMCFGQQK
jgi:hypothetical protein